MTGMEKLTFLFLVGVGSLQMTGDLTGQAELKALGAISHVSPAPKVFTAHEGYETYSPEFFVTAEVVEGPSYTLKLTPEVNGLLRGPYNRRNAYGAALSYGPVLVAQEDTRPLFEAAFRYALCSERGVRAEVALPEAASYRVDIRPRQRPNDGRARSFRVFCATGAVTPLYQPLEESRP